MSAYFPEESCLSGVFPQELYVPSSIHAEKESNLIEFPTERRILWDRSPEVPEIIFLQAKEVLPQVYMSSTETRSIAKALMAGRGSIEKEVRLRDVSFLSEPERAFVYSRSFKAFSTPGHVLCLGNRETEKENIANGGDWMTVPIFSRLASNDDSLSFEEDSTVQMIRNLAKSIRTGKEFSLRSCIRIRGAGHSSLRGDQILASLRFEAVLPNLSFQLTQVKRIPFAKTHLASILQSRHASISNRFGYLTMSRTRKLVPIFEADPCVATAPLVGIWIAGSDTVKHPLIWAACVRYLNFEGIRERVFVDNNTFLLVLINGELQISYEVNTSGVANGVLSLKDESDFLCEDFAFELAIESPNSSDAYDPEDAVIGTFRPLKRPELIKVFRNSCDEVRGFARPPNDIILREPVSHISPTAKVVSSYVSARYEDLSVESSVLVEKSTPLPRSKPPPPHQESPRRSYDNSNNSSIQFDGEVALAEKKDALSGLSLNPRTAIAEFSSVDIIRAQQLQIDYLQRQVEDLKTVIAELQSGKNLHSPSPHTTIDSVHAFSSFDAKQLNFQRKYEHETSFSETENFLPDRGDNTRNFEGCVVHEESSVGTYSLEEFEDEDKDEYEDEIQDQGDTCLVSDDDDSKNSDVENEQRKWQFYMETPSIPVLEHLVEIHKSVTLNPLDSFVPSIPSTPKPAAIDISIRSTAPLGHYYFESESIAAIEAKYINA